MDTTILNHFLASDNTAFFGYLFSLLGSSDLKFSTLLLTPNPVDRGIIQPVFVQYVIKMRLIKGNEAIHLFKIMCVVIPNLLKNSLL